MSEATNKETSSAVHPRGRESGAATVEYFMILGLITAMMIGVLRLLYPSAGRDIESLINAWGDRLATQIAGDKMTKQNESDWGID